MDYKSYKLVVLMVNKKGGESETIEHLYNEVNSTLIPMTAEEAELELLSRISKVGANPAIQLIKVVLYDPYGNPIKTEEIRKPLNAEEELKKRVAQQAFETYYANPTDENLEKIKQAVIA